MKKETQSFTKEQLMHSKRYAHKRDLIDALLTNKESYTLEEVDKRINNFLKRKVK